MRLPTSWKDRSLLDQDPFDSVFWIRKHMHNTRTKGKRDDWLKELAEDVLKKPDTRAAAVRWAEFAFAPEPDAARSVVVAHDSLETVLVFVNFYWTWSNSSASSAQKVVDAERKKRGFWYRLPDIQQKSSAAPAADVSAPATQVADASTGVRGSEDAEEPIEAIPLDAIILQSGDDGEDGKDEMVVFESERDVDMYMIDNLSPLTDISSLGLPEEAEAQVRDPKEAPRRSPTAVEAASPPASGLTTAVEEDEEDASAGVAMLAESPMSRHKKSRREGGDSSGLLSQHPRPTAAANEASRRTLADVSSGARCGPAEHTGGPVQHAHSKKPGSTKKTCAPSANPGTPTRAAGQQPLPTSLPHKSPWKAPPTVVRPPTAAERPPRPGYILSIHAKPQKTRKGAPKMSQRDARGKDSPRTGSTNSDERPTKRQKGRDGYDGIRKLDLNSNTAHVRQHSSPPPSPSMQLSVFGHHAGRLTREPSFFHGCIVMSDRETTPELALSRKRPRDVEDGEGVPLVERRPPDTHSKADRVVAMLPKPRPTSGRKDLPRCPVPKPSLGIPRDLPEADRMLRDSAADALLTLANTVPTAEIWPAREPGAEDDDQYPPSDDEEDVPLREIISARTRAPDAAAVGGDLALLDDAEDDCKDPCDWRASSLPTFLHPHGEVEAGSRPQRLAAALGDLAPLDEAEEDTKDPCEWRLSTPVPSHGAVVADTRPRPSSAIPGPVPAPNPAATRAPMPPPPARLPKPPLTVQPPVWAKSRQEVCESFDWFKSYQGGVYFKDDIAWGYLLGGFYASRDLLARDGRLIISHGGGKAESVHSQKGKKKRQDASDQHEWDKSVRALLKTYQQKREIALLIDDRYALFPYDLSAKKDCTYVVLGFYHIVQAWAERQPSGNAKGYVVRWKFAFEWCERQPSPWWIPSSDATCAIDLDEPEEVAAPLKARCFRCKKSSPLVYAEGWMCLQPSCSAFWILPDGRHAPEELTYDESFLKVSFRCEHDLLEDIRPQPPAVPEDGVVTSRRFSRGWHCNQCGRLSSRYKWQHWECKSCGATMQVMGKNRIPREFWGQNDSKFMTHKVYDSDIIVSGMLPYRTPDGHVSQYHTYTLPHIRGTIYVVLGNSIVNRIADEIFEEYQEQAKTGELQFRRFPLRSHQCRGELLTNYFSQNSGEPYQYVGGTAHTVPFDRAPSAVVKARDLIQSRMMSIMQAESQPYRFNEVLSAAYMEEQSMSFHSDAENGLGPRVASLSLGSSAHMHFRLLKKYRTDGGSGNVPKALTLFLRHGDVLMMDGADIQKYYEHTVVPMNFRIAATARYIGRNHL